MLIHNALMLAVLSNRSFSLKLELIIKTTYKYTKDKNLVSNQDIVTLAQFSI